MGLFGKVTISGKGHPVIDWDLIPADTFGMFESWGGKERVRNRNERFYYFFIDDWNKPARLCLMERGVKHARILAIIDAPQKMIDTCLKNQGKAIYEKSYPIDETIKKWLRKNVVDSDNDTRVIPLSDNETAESLSTGLPMNNAHPPTITQLPVRSLHMLVNDSELPGLIAAKNFYDNHYNPAGAFTNHLVDNGDALTVTDLATGVMWQRGGCDLMNIRNVKSYMAGLNQEGFAGFGDWRLPTIEEALSLLTQDVNEKGLHVHPCFSSRQPFIFLGDQRKPGGYWFANLTLGAIYWASGTNPGGFGRVCRSLH